MGRERYIYRVYDVLFHKELLNNASLSEVSQVMNMSKDKILRYIKEDCLYKRRYKITRRDKPLDGSFEEEWDKYRKLALKALRNPEAISRFRARMQKLATKEG